MKKVNKKLLVLFLSVLIVLLFSSCMSTKENKSQCTIAVSGEGKVLLDPDYVDFSIRVSETASTTAAAQQLANEKMSKIFEILTEYNIDEKDIKTTQLSFNTDYDWIDGKQTYKGEVASQSVTVKMRELDKFDELVDSIGKNVSGLSFDSVNFDKEDKTEAYAEARSLALNSAKSKAEIYAKAGGLSLGKPFSISEGNFTSNNYRTTAKMMVTESVSDVSVSTQAPTGQIEITVTVDTIYQAY